ncbi:MAG TPA: hypothetical protein VMB81_29095 [Candidatus Sulfotelmatobacter sp.]|nr:hypothetical protein [Candidatus Sulfotelmatobacter sp.]
MHDILNSASTAIRQAQLRATSSRDQDTLGLALDFIEGEVPNLLDLVHELIAAYSRLCPEPRRDGLLARAQQVVQRVEGLSLNHVLAVQLAIDEIEE